METETPPVSNGGGRGGRREGAGRKSEVQKKAEKNAARITRYIERIAVACGGKHWQMSDDERDEINEPLADVIVDINLSMLESPYIALTIGALCYVGGKGVNAQGDEQPRINTDKIVEKWKGEGETAEAVEDVENE